MIHSLTKYVAAACIIGALCGCASSPVADKDALPVPPDRIFAIPARQTADQVQITVTRDSGLVAGGCNIGLMVDGSLAAALGTSEQISFFLSPGSHVLTLTAYGHGLCRDLADIGLETVLRPHEPRRYRIVINSGVPALTPS
jgi:hypothetical protein